MTASQPLPTDLGPDHPHLNQMGTDVVAALCFQALNIAWSSNHVKLEVEGFKQSRSAWDGARLANALCAFDPGHPDVVDLVRAIDRATEEAAGIPLPNRKNRA